MEEIAAFDGDAVEYVCNGCRTSKNNQSASLKSLDNTIGQLFQMLKGLAEDVAGLAKFREDTAPRLTNLENITTSLSNISNNQNQLPSLIDQNSQKHLCDPSSSSSEKEINVKIVLLLGA